VAAIAKRDWEETTKSFKEKLAAEISNLSSSDTKLRKMRDVAKEKTAGVQLVQNQMTCLERNIKAARLSIQYLGEKVEHADNSLKAKKAEFVSIFKEQKA